MRIKNLLALTGALCLLLVSGGSLMAHEQVAMVLTSQPGAWAERDGQLLALPVKALVHKNDVLITDATGKMQIIFNDDTTIALGPETKVAVNELVFNDEQPASLSSEVLQGVARFATGQVVERNRQGFTVSTPQATIGIRGTNFSVKVSGSGDDAVTSVMAHQITGGRPIQVTNNFTNTVSLIEAAGIGVDAGINGNLQYQLPPGTAFNSSQTVRARQQQTTNSGNTAQNASLAGSIAAPFQNQDGEQLANAALAVNQVAAGPANNAASNASAQANSADKLTIADNSIRNTLHNSGNLPGHNNGNLPGNNGGLPNIPGTPGNSGGNPIIPGNVVATYAGTLAVNHGATGTFSLDANLGSGSINNSNFQIVGGASAVNAHSGSGSINSNGAYTVNGYTVTNGQPNIPSLHGSYINESNTGGQWQVDRNGAMLDSGKFTGVKQ